MSKRPEKKLISFERPLALAISASNVFRLIDKLTISDQIDLLIGLRVNELERRKFISRPAFNVFGIRQRCRINTPSAIQIFNFYLELFELILIVIDKPNGVSFLRTNGHSSGLSNRLN